MSDDKSQEKTEQATPKRLQDAKEKGQVAQSRDLNSTIIIFCGGVGAIIFGESIINKVSILSGESFSLSREQIFAIDLPLQLLPNLLMDFLWMMLPIFIMFLIASLLGPLLMNGGTITANAVKVKFEKLNPLKGIKKIFALRGLVELIKTLIKFSIILIFATMILWSQFSDLLSLAKMDISKAMSSSLHLLVWAFLAMTSGLVIIAALDVPYQLWEHVRQLKMTKQEVKDEYKDTEGKPEVKAHIRGMQQELAKKRMMEAVPQADVVITNPTHYAVAISYEDEGQSAPRVVAKGKDLIAQQIRNIATEHNVPLIEAPPLARSIFFSTKLNHEIPRGLYVAVAQVLAYVYQLKAYKNGKNSKPKPLNGLHIPDDLYRE